MPAPFRTTFQTKFFFAALSAAVIALAVAGVLFATTMRRQMDAKIETTLVAEAGRAAQADRLGALISARVTFIASDGRVVGDSAETLEGVAAMENHAQRPEI